MAHLLVLQLQAQVVLDLLRRVVVPQARCVRQILQSRNSYSQLCMRLLGLSPVRRLLCFSRSSIAQLQRCKQDASLAMMTLHEQQDGVA